MFADPNVILEQEYFLLIQDWQSSKMLNLPIAKTLGEAPADLVDCFLIIESEMNAIANYESVKNGSKKPFN
jgi:hypothetical protein|tara:strand:- start:1366 stop:1578 length:213 start_codon:yes stop_codon:yes gene_type:complete